MSKTETTKVNCTSTLFFARLGTLKQQDLRAYCEKYGDVKDVTIITDSKTMKSKGCGFVKFVTHIAANKCLEASQNHCEPGKKPWVVEWAKSTQIKEKDLDKFTLYITGITKEICTEENLRERFSKYGQIESITIPTVNGNVQYAFICFSTKESAADALINENGSEWDGNMLSVEYSEATESKRIRRQKASMKKLGIPPEMYPVISPIISPIVSPLIPMSYENDNFGYNNFSNSYQMGNSLNGSYQENNEINDISDLLGNGGNYTNSTSIYSIQKTNPLGKETKLMSKDSFDQKSPKSIQREKKKQKQQIISPPNIYAPPFHPSHSSSSANNSFGNSNGSLNNSYNGSYSNSNNNSFNSSYTSSGTYQYNATYTPTYQMNNHNNFNPYNNSHEQEEQDNNIYENEIDDGDLLDILLSHPQTPMNYPISKSASPFWDMGGNSDEENNEIENLSFLEELKNTKGDEENVEETISTEVPHFVKSLLNNEINEDEENDLKDKEKK